ncbi:MAG: hypothetical protein GY913_16910 [Proteobacteria bacterium]|nr:hypothetical protein [Pseudomonadota bacterium]
MGTLGLLAALASNPAEAGEGGKTLVGTEKQFGLGVVLGSHSLTGKYWLNKKSGISFYVNPGLLASRGHVAYESNFWEIGNWNFAKLDMYWNVGAVGGAVYSTGALVGVGGGVGATMRFKSVPAEAFIHNHLYTIPTYYKYNFGYVSWFGGAGGRWYF